MNSQSIHLVLGAMGKGVPCELDLVLTSDAFSPQTLNDLGERIRAMLVLQFPHGTILHSRITPVRDITEEAENGAKEE